MRKFYKLLSAFIAAALMTASMSAAVFADGENDSQPADTEAAGIGTTVTETTDTETPDTETTDTETTDTVTTDTETTENASGDLEDTDFSGGLNATEDESDTLEIDILNIMSLYKDSNGDAQAVVDVLAEKDDAYRQVLLDQIQTESSDMYDEIMAIYNAVPEIVSLENYDSYYISDDKQGTVLRTSMNANGKALSGYFQFSVTGEAQTGTDLEDVAEKTAEFKFNVGQLDGSSVLMSGEAEYVFGMLVPGVCFTGDVNYTSEYTE